MTLNQVIDRTRTLALSHKQINSFLFVDEVPEFDANGEINYPACFLQIQPGRVDRTEHLQYFNFRMFLLDLVPESTETEQNETDVLSDMHSVCADMLAMMMFSDYQFDWEIGTTAQINPVTEGLNDLTAGVFADIEIAVEFLADRCQVPANDVTFEEDFYMARTKILTYNGTGAEGNSFIVTGLAGKTVLAIYRAGQYKRAITTDPANAESIKVVGTDLGDYKGILSTTGVVTMEVGDGLLLNEKLDFIIWAS